ncbi:MAG: hypothetical protein ACRDOO_14765, partial [Actinomadura sp.]
MRAYLAIAVQRPGASISAALLDAARRAIGEAVPVPGDRWRTVEWRSADGGVALLAWSNEPAGGALTEPLVSDGDRALGYCGYLGEPGEE